jgi:hypothetical protein
MEVTRGLETRGEERHFYCGYLAKKTWFVHSLLEGGVRERREKLSVTPVDTGSALAGLVNDASVFSGLFQQENGKTVD